MILQHIDIGHKLEEESKMETQYEVIEDSRFPERSLIRTPRGVVRLKAFGPASYKDNLTEMMGEHFYPRTGERITFREPTTAESIWAAAYEFEYRAKPQILDLKRLQLGRVVEITEGVFANPPKDKNGKPIVEEAVLKSMLDGAKNLNGVCFYHGKDSRLRDFGFASYETIERGMQENLEFAEGGLARLFEHSEEDVAENLQSFSGKWNYPKGVNIWGFDRVGFQILRIASLSSISVLGSGRLYVDGYHDFGEGYAFGVLNESQVGGRE